MFRKKNYTYALLPDQFDCPITTEAVKEPAVLDCGHVIEKSTVKILIDRHEKKLNDKLCCPTCKKDFEKGKVSYSFKEGWDALRSRLVTAETNLTKKEAEFKRLQGELSTLTREVDETTRILNEHNERIFQLDRTNENLEQQVNKLKELNAFQIQTMETITKEKLSIEKKSKDEITLQNQKLIAVTAEKNNIENQLKIVQNQFKAAQAQAASLSLRLASQIEQNDDLGNSNKILQTQLASSQAETKSLSAELKAEKEKNDVLEILQTQLAISQLGQDCAQNKELLISFADKLKVIFNHKKNILDILPILETIIQKINTEIKDGVYNRFTDHLNQIIALKKNIKTVQDAKTELVKKCKADSAFDLTLVDAKEIGEKLILIQQQFHKDMKAQDDVIQDLSKKVKDTQRKMMEESCKFLQLTNERHTTFKKIKQVLDKQEIEKLDTQTKLFSIPFFRTHQQSLYNFVMRSKQKVAFRTLVKEKDYKAIPVEFKKLHDPNKSPKIDGCSTVQYAVMIGDITMIMAFLDAKADFNFIFSDPKNSGKYSCLTYLLQYAYDAHGQCKYNKQKFDEMILRLIDNMDIKALNFTAGFFDALLYAIDRKQVQFVKQLLYRQVAITDKHFSYLMGYNGLLQYDISDCLDTDFYRKNHATKIDEYKYKVDRHYQPHRYPYHPY